MTIKNVSALIIALIISSSIQCRKCGCLDEERCLDEKIDRMFAKVHSKSEQVRKNLDKMFSSEIMISQKGEKVKIELYLGENIKSFDGDITDNKLKIKIPKVGQEIVVKYDDKTKFLSVGTEKKQKREEKDKIKYSLQQTYGKMEQGQTIASEIKFSKAKFEYKNGRLIISIPKIFSEKKSKKIKVDIK